MEIENNSINQVAQTSKTNVVSPYGETKEEIDYSEYTISEIRDIPYAEAKENYDQIMERATNLEKQGVDEESFIATMQLEKINYSDNNKLNEVLYETMRLTDDPKDALLLDSEIQVNLQDYYYGKDITASFVISDSNDSGHAHKELNRTQLSNINVDDFINKMLEAFTNDYNNTKGGAIKEQYKNIVDG